MMRAPSLVICGRPMEWERSAHLHVSGIVRSALHAGGRGQLARHCARYGGRGRVKTLLSATSFELHVSRPFWFGSFGLAPAVGAHFLSARRNVQVDDRGELFFPLFVPQAGLWLLYRRVGRSQKRSIWQQPSRHCGPSARAVRARPRSRSTSRRCCSDRALVPPDRARASPRTRRPSSLSPRQPRPARCDTSRRPPWSGLVWAR